MLPAGTVAVEPGWAVTGFPEYVVFGAVAVVCCTAVDGLVTAAAPGAWMLGTKSALPQAAECGLLSAGRLSR